MASGIVCGAAIVDGKPGPRAVVCCLRPYAPTCSCIATGHSHAGFQCRPSTGESTLIATSRSAHRAIGLFTAGMIGTILLACPHARAQSCGNSAGGFSSWLTSFRKVAISKGISPGTVNAALGGVSYYRRAVRLDRSQRSFKLSYRQFYRRRVSGSLLSKGRRLMRRHRSLCAHPQALRRAA